VWLLLVGWLALELSSRAGWSEESDRATVVEWLDEARNFRKTLPELVREYVASPTQDKRDELAEHLRGLAEPTRAYLNQLPAFPTVYRITVRFRDDALRPVVWDSTLPRPREQNQTRVKALTYRLLGEADDRATVTVDYQLHAFNKLAERERVRRRESLAAGAVLVAATALAAVFVGRFLQRERRREQQRLAALAEAEHREREALAAKLQQAEAERARDDLDRRLLEQKLEAADLEKRAAEAERSALNMKSQLFAGIGIMAGSYAHNIKNLLVRPNDLLNRCLERDGLPAEQATMLTEVKATLGTVTERLQQILRTVRRDPTQSERSRVDLAALVRATVATWEEMAREKWKVQLAAEVAPGDFAIDGDESHLQQAVENLLFNARDATFEMRNRLREEARRDATPDRRQRLLDAAAWKGRIALGLSAEAGRPVLTVSDNGVGMSAEVRANCLRTHFSTKRNNALFEGHTAGMGLGLSFVAVVLEHHGADLAIDSTPLAGATFRVRFPAAGRSGLPTAGRAV
jgi:signal transduction histidine kinase